MIIDTEKLLAAIDQYESNEIPNLAWRKTIDDFCALAESFPESVEFCLAGEVDFSKKLNRRRIKRNMQRREMNRTLSELCGVSARAAREDMGM